MLLGGQDETIKGETTQLIHLWVPEPSVASKRKFRLFLSWVHPSTYLYNKKGVFLLNRCGLEMIINASESIIITELKNLSKNC